MRTEAPDHCPGTVTAPGKAIPRLPPPQVDNLKTVIEFACKSREDEIPRAETLLVGQNPRISLPHMSQPVFVDVVDQALMWRLEHPEELGQELL
jgi:hypothetical protein